VRGRVVFVEDYGLEVAGEMVQGVDLWLNTPRRGEEACGTSGMKAGINGVLSLSILDGWFDEAAQSPERAYDVFRPTLIKAGGIVIATTTVMGFDWTYSRIEQLAARGEAGYWAIKYWTEENPLFRSQPTMMRKIEQDRRVMSPEFFAQEYKAERRSATGLVYDFSLLEKHTLNTDDEVRKILPEWPNINSDREVLVGYLRKYGKARVL
jgi:hypothetical protein